MGVKIGLVTGVLGIGFSLIFTALIRWEFFSRDYAILFLLCYIVAQNIIQDNRDG